MRSLAPQFLSILAMAVSLSPASAQQTVSGVSIQRDVSTTFDQDPRGSGNFSLGEIPNQAIAFAGVQIPTFPNPIFLAQGACTVGVPGCFAPPPLPRVSNFVHQIDDVTLTFSSSAGNDLVSASVQGVSDAEGPVSVFSPVQASASEWQKVTFSVAGDVPGPIPVDVRFSVSATMDDATGALQGQGMLQTFALGQMSLIDIATLAPVPDGGFMANVLLRGGAFAGFAGAGGIEEAIGIDVVETVMVAPNLEYWISLDAIAQLSTSVFGSDPITGPLDVTLSAWADPVFELNAAFAAENPGIADTFSVLRTVVVPIPAALPLLASALAVLMAVGRSRGMSGVR